VTQTYRAISQVAKALAAKAELPLREGRLDSSDPEVFFSEIQRRILEAHGAIAVFVDGDTSVPIEIAYTAFAGKPQLIVSASEGVAPRLMRGLPKVWRVLAAKDPQLPLRIHEFILMLGSGGPPVQRDDTSPWQGLGERR
jgi:hypothetical protein